MLVQPIGLKYAKNLHKDGRDDTGNITGWKEYKI